MQPPQSRMKRYKFRQPLGEKQHGDDPAAAAIQRDSNANLDKLATYVNDILAKNQVILGSLDALSGQ
eukprot:6708413-Karenia_brevis.AAC.1